VQDLRPVSDDGGVSLGSASVRSKGKAQSAYTSDILSLPAACVGDLSLWLRIVYRCRRRLGPVNRLFSLGGFVHNIEWIWNLDQNSHHAHQFLVE
jgi:hypothetical protein